MYTHIIALFEDSCVLSLKILPDPGFVLTAEKPGLRSSILRDKSACRLVPRVIGLFLGPGSGAAAHFTHLGY